MGDPFGPAGHLPYKVEEFCLRMDKLFAAMDYNSVAACQRGSMKPFFPTEFRLRRRLLPFEAGQFIPGDFDCGHLGSVETETLRHPIASIHFSISVKSPRMRTASPSCAWNNKIPFWAFGK